MVYSYKNFVQCMTDMFTSFGPQMWAALFLMLIGQAVAGDIGATSCTAFDNHMCTEWQHDISIMIPRTNALKQFDQEDAGDYYKLSSVTHCKTFDKHICTEWHHDISITQDIQRIDLLKKQKQKESDDRREERLQYIQDKTGITNSTVLNVIDLFVAFVIGCAAFVLFIAMITWMHNNNISA